MALWVALLFVGLQQLEGHVVAPNVFGRTLRLNPLLVIFALLLGGQVYGFVGAIIALPIAAVVRETIVYLKRHLVFEPWTDTPMLVADRAAPPPVEPSPAAEEAPPPATAADPQQEEAKRVSSRRR